MQIIGWDIGGANIKATLMEIREKKAYVLKTIRHYFPLWIKGKEKLPFTLKMLKTKLVRDSHVDFIGVTMTAELSDVYRTKKDGVRHILDCIEEVFPEELVFVLDVNAHLITIEKAKEEHLNVASANWAGTAWMVSKLVKDCIVLDVGSTTTDIIPIFNGEVMAMGKTDLERLATGELVYSGALRTNVATIVEKILVKGLKTRVSSELFALSGDVHLILGNLKQDDYITETADGRGKTRGEALSRLSRLVCADTYMLKEDDIFSIADYVHRKQLDKIADGLTQVYDSIKPLIKNNISLVITGIGRDFLGRRLGEKLGFKNIIDLAQIIGYDASIVTPSVAVASIVAYNQGAKEIEWSQ